MCNIDLVKDIFVQIDYAIDKIQFRFSSIRALQDFTDSPEGLMKLDSICMLLIAIGESLKNIDKISNSSLLAKYPEVNRSFKQGFQRRLESL